MPSKTDPSASKPKPDFAELSIAVVGGLALALIALFLCVVPLTGEVASGRDFVVYWATGQQLTHHANPYDAEAMMRIERTAGLPAQYGTLYMRNPPLYLLLAYPLGFIGLRMGALIWALIMAGLFVVSVRMESAALVGIFVRAGHGLRVRGADFPDRAARAGSFSSLPCCASLRSRAISLVMRSEAAPVSSFRNSIACLDSRYTELQDGGGRCNCVRRELRTCILH